MACSCAVSIFLAAVFLLGGACLALEETCQKAADQFCTRCGLQCSPWTDQRLGEDISPWRAERLVEELQSYSKPADWECVTRAGERRGLGVHLKRSWHVVDAKHRRANAHHDRGGEMVRDNSNICNCLVYRLQLQELIAQCMDDTENTTDVFVEHESDINVYRIPAIVQTVNGTLLAFAEGRSELSDCRHKAIVLKRSMDMGKTWGDLQTVYGMQDKHLVVGNPMPVVDQQTGDIYLQFVTNKDSTGCNPGVNNWQVVSEDNGKTWSVPTNLSDVLTPYNGVLPGPGAALQLTKVKPGRLMFSGHYGAYREDVVWYSDDHGKTYHRVNITFPKMDEVTLTQLENGSILLNMRNAHISSCNCRATSRSDDGGETWSAIRFDSTLISPVCQAALAQIGSRLFFSNPASTKERENLTIRVSHDGGTSWSSSTHLVAAGSTWGGYSSLVPAELGGDGKTGLGGILYERYNPDKKQVISFSTFPLSFGDPLNAKK